MARRKPEFRMITHGIYTKWISESKDLPSFQEQTTQIPARVDIEFGFIVSIKNAKNESLQYCIDHPGIRDSDGKVRAPFEGIVYVKSNDWQFYLGDTIWEPIADKLGDWRMTLEHDGKVIADKTFHVSEGSYEENQSTKKDSPLSP
ncbi:DUF3859 domain-containing protein [Rubripirellula amarantea]|uniref:DUF3859 domain-containing protein n=1 Tax=Rubripirellula amarantea TaxID=2527999 RepID=A0A5C5WF91_9BACT|nr:DUF3859 domain-containing protein [Rubripirellula amarantea]MDA8743170.1 DUF3859 domain-containing protein [Rubripirellula amarantea]TWT49434.1 hypothetical protein Pla22_46300 [Rubripirellula amarantea]